MFWKKKKKYSEVYLDYDGEEIVESKKTKRIEIGEEETLEDLNTGTALPVGESSASESIEDGPVDDIDGEEEQGLEKPQYKWVRIGIIAFWIAFGASALLFFIPLMKDTFNQTFDYNSVVKDVVTNIITPVVDEGDVEPVEESPDIDDPVSIPPLEETPSTSSPGAETPVSDTPVVSDVPSIEDTSTNAPVGSDVSGVNPEATQVFDAARAYSNIHTFIVDSTQDLRDKTEGYITRTGHHVGVVSAGRNIRAKLGEAYTSIDMLEEHPIQEILTKRLDRLGDIADKTAKFDRENAAGVINSFLAEENEDSVQFVEELKQLLKEEGRAFTLEEGVITFE